jgi:hypothetical protein
MVSKKTLEEAALRVEGWADKHNVPREAVAELLAALRSVDGNRSWTESLAALSERYSARGTPPDWAEAGGAVDPALRGS